MSASIIQLPTRQGHQDAGSFAALAIALANVRMACDRCEAVARRIEGGNGADFLPMLSDAMHQVARQAGKVSRAGVSGNAPLFV